MLSPRLPQAAEALSLMMRRAIEAPLFVVLLSVIWAGGPPYGSLRCGPVATA